MGPVASPAADTFPRLLLDHARVRPDHPAMREKDLGIWQTWTWAQLARRWCARSPAAWPQRGLQARRAPGVVGDNRPRLYAAMLAAQSLGAIPVPLYQDAVGRASSCSRSTTPRSRFAIVEDQEQVDKLLEMRAAVPAARAHLLRRPARPAQLQRAGPGVARRADRRRAARSTRRNPGFFDAEVAQGAARDDVAAMFYTSGTTGKPKGVVHTHATLIDRAARRRRASTG